MKRLIAVACFAFTFVALSHAQNLDKIVNAFKANKAVAHQKMTVADIMGQMQNVADSLAEDALPDFMKKIDFIEVFTLKGENAGNANGIVREIGNYKDGNGFETLISVNEGAKKVKIVVHKKDDLVSEVGIMATEEKGDIAFVRLRFSGKVAMSDLQDILNEQKINISKQ